MGDLTPIAQDVSLLIGMFRSNEPDDVSMVRSTIDLMLKRAGCSWADLAAVIAARPKARQGRRQPRLWPTFGSLTHDDRLKWLDLVRPSTNGMGEKARAEFEDLRTKIIMRPNEALTQPEVGLFNRLIRAAARRGERI